MNFIDYYESLGLSRSATQDEIKKAYRKLAARYHPDRNQDSGASDKFKEINEAYEVLSDPEKRQRFDQYGSAWNQVRSGGAPPPGFENFSFDFGPDGPSFGTDGFSDFFEMLFGGARPGRAAGGPSPFGGAGFGAGGFTQAGQDVEARLRLSLREAAQGGKRGLTLQDPASGKPRTIQVKIPAGVRPGQKIRLGGQGGPGNGGGPAGDLYLLVELEPDARFRFEDGDLHVSVPVAPWTAALGGRATVPTLENELTVKVPAGSSSGRRIRLRGKGFPSTKGEPGDLFAELKIVVPSELSAEEEELFRSLADRSDFAPRPGAEQHRDQRETS